METASRAASRAESKKLREESQSQRPQSAAVTRSQRP